jgi:hypothetical protein
MHAFIIGWMQRTPYRRPLFVLGSIVRVWIKRMPFLLG